MPGLRTLELEPELGSGFAANTFVSRVAKFAANTIALCHLVIATYRSDTIHRVMEDFMC